MEVAARAVLDQDVAGLHVAVDEPRGVGGVEGGGDLLDDLDGLLGLEAPGPAEQHPQVGPVDEAHREPQVRVVLARLEHLHDVGVVEAGGHAGLAPEPLAERGVVGERPPDDLQRDLPLESLLVRQVDDARRAVPELALDAEARETISGSGQGGHVRHEYALGAVAPARRTDPIGSGPAAMRDVLRHARPPPHPGRRPRPPSTPYGIEKKSSVAKRLATATRRPSLRSSQVSTWGHARSAVSRHRQPLGGFWSRMPL